MGHFVSITRSGGSELVEQCGTRSQQVRAHTGDALEPFHGTEVAIGGAIGPLNGLKGPKCIQGHHSCLWPEYCIDSHFLGLCAIPFRLCFMLCYPFRVTTAAYGQNTAFMAILGPLSAPLATWNGHSRSKKRYQQFSLEVCYPVPTLFQAVPSIKGHHSCLWPEYCIYGLFQLLWPPGTAIPSPKTVVAVQSGCVLSRSNFVPSCATHSGSPRVPTARTLHLWPF